MKRVLLACAIVLSAACTGSDDDPDEAFTRIEARPKNGELVFAQQAGARWRLLSANPEGGPPQPFTDRLFPNPEIAVSPDGKRIAFSFPAPSRDVARGWGRHDILIAGVGLEPPHRRLRTRGDDGVPRWSPNGRWIAFSNSSFETQHLYVAEVERPPPYWDTPRAVMARSGQEWGGWSPEGDRIVYSHGTEFLGSNDLFVQNVGTYGMQRLTSDEGSEYGVFGPGRRIAFVSANGNGNSQRGEVEVMNDNGGDRRPIARTDGAVGELAWSPDGSRIALNVHFDEADRVIVVPADRDSGELTVSDGFSGGDALWAPDGSRLAFIRGARLQPDVWIARPNGTRAQQITRGMAPEQLVAWLPAETTIGRDAAFHGFGTRASDSPRLVFVVTAKGENRYKPSSFRPPGGGVMKDIEWGSYGRGPAWGEGEWYGRRVPFQLNTISECRGRRAYLYFSITESGRAPPFPVSHCDEPELQRPPAG
jgi:Tol biopolymer transport system component